LPKIFLQPKMMNDSVPSFSHSCTAHRFMGQVCAEACPMTINP
jgi:hypothetical protein